MNQAGMTCFSYEKLEAWGRSALETTPMSQEETGTVIKVLLDTNLRGMDTHGINMLPSYVQRYNSIAHRDIAVVEDRGAGCIIDGGNHTGQMTSMFAMEKAMAKADQYGLGLALVKESCHNGAVGYYASLAAEKGYISLVTTTVMPLIAPWGGLEPFIGNNPYAVGFPYKEKPIVLDVANTVAARQKIFSYAREGWQLPDGWAMDKEGNPTNDPQEAINGLLMPVGGHKGAGLAAMIDIILGTLGGGRYSRSICANTVTDREQHITHLFFFMNPDFYMNREDLDNYIAQYASDFKSVARKKDVPEILLPGELEWKNTQERRKNGIPVSAAVLKELNAFADKIGIAHLE
ncbi:MAG: Ldh family oxidoreductase [Ruminococcaceae bacterium]|nr:Ldh family oxidoreductase [Oscillospiraceae bacterium]